MWFHLQTLLLLAQAQPPAELAPMMLSSQATLKMGFTKTLYVLKQMPSFHLKIF